MTTKAPPSTQPIQRRPLSVAPRLRMPGLPRLGLVRSAGRLQQIEETTRWSTLQGDLKTKHPADERLHIDAWPAMRSCTHCYRRVAKPGTSACGGSAADVRCSTHEVEHNIAERF